ncbi:hypothetical protein CIK98_14680 [Prevotella sp. P2-180]|nr:hypothetical protein CIK98_14680 [Prevotella sp. P2-180]
MMPVRKVLRTFLYIRMKRTSIDIYLRKYMVYSIVMEILLEICSKLISVIFSMMTPLSVLMSTYHTIIQEIKQRIIPTDIGNYFVNKDRMDAIPYIKKKRTIIVIVEKLGKYE